MGKILKQTIVGGLATLLLAGSAFNAHGQEREVPVKRATQLKFRLNKPVENSVVAGQSFNEWYVGYQKSQTSLGKPILPINFLYDSDASVSVGRKLSENLKLSLVPRGGRYPTGSIRSSSDQININSILEDLSFNSNYSFLAGEKNRAAMASIFMAESGGDPKVIRVGNELSGGIAQLPMDPQRLYSMQEQTLNALRFDRSRLERGFKTAYYLEKVAVSDLIKDSKWMAEMEGRRDHFVKINGGDYDALNPRESAEVVLKEFRQYVGEANLNSITPQTILEFARAHQGARSLKTSTSYQKAMKIYNAKFPSLK